MDTYASSTPSFSTPSFSIPSSSTSSTFAPSTSTPSTTYSQDSIKSLNLNEIFDQEATDLDDEDEKPAFDSSNTTATTPAAVTTITSEVSMLRKFLPEDLSHQIKNFYNDLSPEIQQESWANVYAKGNVDWKYMVEASREIRLRGRYVRKHLEPADRSLDWFWENGRPSHNDNFLSVPMESDKVEPTFHHLNYLGHPVSYKSSTPASESLWLTFTSQKPFFDSLSRKGVINSQATKLIDPFVYLPPQDEDENMDILQYTGTALKNAVEGHVVKAYDDNGTWAVEDGVASTSDWDEIYIFQHQAPVGYLQAPHWMNHDDDDDIIVNDDGKGCYYNPTASKCTPSNLRAVEFADYASLEVAPTLSYLQLPETEESTTLSPPASGNLVSTPSSLSSESVTEEVVEEVEKVVEEEKVDSTADPIPNPAPSPSKTTTSPSPQPSHSYLKTLVVKAVEENMEEEKNVDSTASPIPNPTPSPSKTKTSPSPQPNHSYLSTIAKFAVQKATAACTVWLCWQWVLRWFPQA